MPVPAAEATYCSKAGSVPLVQLEFFQTMQLEILLQLYNQEILLVNLS